MPGKRKSEAERKKQIGEALLTVALKRGLSSVTVRAVAEEAGLSHGLVGFYYPKKEDLLHLLLDNLLEWVYGPESEISQPKVNGRQSSLCKGIAQELEAQDLEKEKILLLLEFWILSSRREEYGEKIKETIQQSSKYFSQLYQLDKKKQLMGQQDLERPYTDLSICLVLGGALRGIIDEDFRERGLPEKDLEEILLNSY